MQLTYSKALRRKFRHFLEKKSDINNMDIFLFEKYEDEKKKNEDIKKDYEEEKKEKERLKLQNENLKEEIEKKKKEIERNNIEIKYIISNLSI